MNKTVLDHSIQICILCRIFARCFFPLIKLEEKKRIFKRVGKYLGQSKSSEGGTLFPQAEV